MKVSAAPLMAPERPERFPLCSSTTAIRNSSVRRSSIAFLDSKRPYTVKLLSRVDLNKCISNVPVSELILTESVLKLPSLITQEMYSRLKAKVC